MIGVIDSSRFHCGLDPLYWRLWFGVELTNRYWRMTLQSTNSEQSTILGHPNDCIRWQYLVDWCLPFQNTPAVIRWMDYSDVMEHRHWSHNLLDITLQSNWLGANDDTDIGWAIIEVYNWWLLGVSVLSTRLHHCPLYFARSTMIMIIIRALQAHYNQLIRRKPILRILFAI